MPEFIYLEARKQGLKDVRACTARGEYPYLSALDEILPDNVSVNGRSLGIVQIPSEFIVGTKNRGRTESFSRSFLPILDDKTEFASKWKNLCAAHLDEGIREPVKVYEYLNRYYVEEGNKRVSVLKYFGAVNIPAVVTRIMPEQIPENELYFEYLAFNKLTGIYFLEFSRKGCYAELLRLMGKDPNTPWTEEERRKFSADYSYFRSAYEEKGGGKLRITVGDAMLACMKVYGYVNLSSLSVTEIKKTIGEVWEELALKQEAAPIEVKTTPAEEAKPGLLSHILPSSAPKTLKVAFLHDGNPDISGWTLGHERGREHIQNVFNGRIETISMMNAMDGDPNEAVDRAVAADADVLFTTSPRLLQASLRAAVENKQRIILNCSLNTSHRYIRTYYARMFEAKFIIGAIAGALTMSGRVGYICDYPIFGQIAGINAFALGVQTVNPRAKVFLEWSSVGGKEAAQKRLMEKGMHLISSQDIARLSEVGTSFGLAHISEEGTVPLATPVWNWGRYYEELIRRILDGSFRKEYESSTKALNYYWGMAAGVVGLECTEEVPESVRKLAGYLKDSICADVLRPFTGPIYRQDGSQVCAAGERLDLESIINMDYLVENIEGSIPEYEALTPKAQATVDEVGVGPAKAVSERAI